MTGPKTERNLAILAAVKAGVTIKALAEQHGIHPHTVSDIVRTYGYSAKPGAVRFPRKRDATGCQPVARRRARVIDGEAWLARRHRYPAILTDLVGALRDRHARRGLSRRAA